jgi:replication factor A2
MQYKIDDGTAIVEIRKYIDVDRDKMADDMNVLDEDADSKQAALGHGSLPIEEGSFVRVHGRLKSFNNKRFVGANFVRAIADVDEVHYHLLEATAVHLFYTKGPLGGAGGANHTDGGDSMFVDGGYGSGGAGVGGGQPKTINGSASAQRMFNYMQSAPGGNEGMRVEVLASSLGMSVRDVMAAADELLSQGVIYTTVDDETWAVLDY